MNEPVLSVVLPCFNGAGYVADSLRRLDEFLGANQEEIGSYEIILVDDGSADGTADIVSRDFPGVTLLRQERNRGKGAAVRRGMLTARGRYRMFIDADLPFELEVVPKMLHYLSFKEFDICIGSRSKEAGKNALRRKPLRRFASWFFTLLISRLVVTGVRDTQCGIKAFQGKVADYLFAQSTINGFAFDVEILYLAFKNEMDIKRLPVVWTSDDHSTISVWRHSLGILRDVLMLPVKYYSHRYRMFDEYSRKERK
jgi:dolichyl-phosphate beta-glucosyltransferase